MSMRPNVSSVFWTAASMSSSLPTSSLTGSARAPRASTSLATVWIVPGRRGSVTVSLRAATTMSAPRLGEGYRDVAADTAARAGDESDLTGEGSICVCHV